MKDLPLVMETPNRRDDVGIRASYWVTGGILTVLGLAVARILLGFLGGVALAVGAFLLKAGLVLAAILVIALVLRAVRGRRPAEV